MQFSESNSTRRGESRLSLTNSSTIGHVTCDNARMSPAENQSTAPNPRRRWIRFSLRTLLILLTLACLWLGWQAKRARDQRQAIATIRAAAGTVLYTYQFDANGVFADYGNKLKPLAPAWLRDALGQDFFISIHDVKID